MLKRSLVIIVAMGISKLTAMQSPVLSRSSSFELEKRSAEAEKLREQTPPLFLAIQDLAKAIDTAEMYKGKPAVGQREINSASQEELLNLQKAAEAYLSWVEWGGYPGKEGLEKGYRIALEKLSQGSELRGLINKNTPEAVASIQKYLVDAEEKMAEDSVFAILKEPRVRTTALELRDPYGQSILHLLARVDSSGRLYNLLKKDINMEELIKVQDDKLNTIFHTAALFGNTSFFGRFMKIDGKDREELFTRNAEGKTPLDIALENDRTEIAAILTPLPDGSR